MGELAPEQLSEGLQAAAQDSVEGALRLFSRLVKDIASLEARKNQLLEEVASLNREAAQLSGQISAESRERELLEDESARLRAEASELQSALSDTLALKKRELEILEEERGHLQTMHAQLQESLREALCQAGDIMKSVLALESRRGRLERDLVAKQEELAQVEAELTRRSEEMKIIETQAADIETNLDQLREKYQRLLEEGRPLKPYRIPPRLPRLATANRKIGTAVTELDFRALHLYREAGGGEIGAIVQHALRNFIPHEHYHEALERIRLDVQKLVETQGPAEEGDENESREED